jgi:oligoribonuclease
MLLIFLDTETTGLNPEKHRIIDIAFKVVDTVTMRHVVSYEAIVAQSREVFAAADKESLIVNGFNWEKLLGGKSEKVVAAEIANDINHTGIQDKTGVFICQNPSFDRAFFSQLINVDLQEQYNWPYHWLDLASMYFTTRILQDKNIIKGMNESDLSKNKIAAHYGLPSEAEPHRAMNGVNHLIACYEAMFGNFLSSPYERIEKPL